MSPASPQTAAVLRKVVGEMDKRVVEVIVGGKEEGESATSNSWGRGTFPRLSLHTCPRSADALAALLAVVFTGSTRVGKEVAVACARTLTPCTLEVRRPPQAAPRRAFLNNSGFSFTQLGGKNPAIIDESADLHIAAKRTLVYKAMNCSQVRSSSRHVGRVSTDDPSPSKQTCTTTDYTLVPPALQEPYIDHCLSLLKAWFPDGELASSSYGTLSRSRIEHLVKLLDETKGTVLRRGVVDLERGKMGISIVADVREGDVLMKEEIFGPILVVVPSEVRPFASYASSLRWLTAAITFTSIGCPCQRQPYQQERESTRHLALLEEQGSHRLRCVFLARVSDASADVLTRVLPFSSP